MERTHRTILLTPLATLAALAALALTRTAPPAQGDLAVTELVPVRGSMPARLCPGDNALRVTMVWHGPPPTAAARPVSLRLALVLPGGPPSGTLIAEGSAMPQPGAALTTFTFLHVDIPERLRGRGAQLVVRATPPDAATERPNTAVTLPVDAVADWNCRSGGG